MHTSPPILRPGSRSSLIEASHKNIAGYWYLSVPSLQSITLRIMILDKENYFVNQIKTISRNYSESQKAMTSGVYINGKSKPMYVI